MMRKALFVILFIGSCSPWVLAQEAKKDSTRAAKADSAAVVDEEALEAELAKELGALTTGSQSTTTPPDQTTQTEITGTIARGGTVLNPQVSVIGTFLGSGTSKGAVARKVDLGLAEGEFSFQAYVDPYAKADFFLGFGRESEDPFLGPDEEAATSGEFHAELEEGYLTTLSLPYSLQIKAGKFLSTFGKINNVHSHAHNFLDFPRMYVNYFGEEGLLDRGVSINWLVPNPFGFFQELTLEATSGALEGPAFSGSPEHLLYLLHLKNFFDLDENTTLEIGLTGLDGPNSSEGRKTRIGAFDITLRWKPLRFNRYKSLEWITEALWSRYETPDGHIASNALYTFLRYQIGKRWFLGGRYDYSEFPDNGSISEKGYSAILSFYATEFQKIELQFTHGIPAGRDSFNRLLLRAVFVIGAHGAHKY